MTELDDFRADKDAFFKQHPRCPLIGEQRAAFSGLDYFPEDDALGIEAVLDTDVDRDEAVVMETTAGGEQVYRRAGKVRFELDGEPAELTLYASGQQWELFAPFRDATSEKETYGAGRYLEVEPPGEDGRVMVDFNLAYNPYCAYKPKWACPIPPGENWLPVPIRAGEKAFGDVG